MSAISMCNGVGLHKCGFCYRRTAKPDPFVQTYVGKPPIDDYGQCSMFVDQRDWALHEIEEEPE